MTPTALTIIAAGVLGFSFISGRIQKTVLTPPMIFMLFGLLFGPHGLGFISFNVEHGFIHILAELTLILVLFTDASRIDLRLLCRQHDFPLRLLLLGLPLTIVLGVIAAIFLFPQLNIWEAAVLAAILAPTDAALGQAVVSSKIVPIRIRQALNVESGLNDGMVLPLILIFISLGGVSAHLATISYWVKFTAMQVIFGPLVGIAVGYCGGKVIKILSNKGWMSHIFQELSALGLAILAYALAESIHGNGFISAFFAGLILGNYFRSLCTCLYEFAEAEGQLLTLLTFMIFGAVLLPTTLEHLNIHTITYAILSLTLIRMVPVALSLIGVHLRWVTIGFLGWFGPRGIASILFALLVLEKASIPGKQEILSIVALTVFGSVILHGVSAYPFSKWYGKRLSKDMKRLEHMKITPMPTRYPSTD